MNGLIVIGRCHEMEVNMEKLR